MNAHYCQDCGRQAPPTGACRCRSRRFGLRPPFHVQGHCRECCTRTTWQQAGCENGKHPPVLYWICTVCGATRYQFADCTNVESMCMTVLEENLRLTGANVDHDEAYSRLVLEAWRLYLAYNPESGLTFESYGFGILRRRAYDIYRQMLGRNGEKPLANPISLDAVFDEGEDDEDGYGYGHLASKREEANLDYVVALGAATYA